MKNAVIVVALLLAAACRTPSSVAPLSVPLKYKMMVSPAEVPSLPACAAISRVNVDDARDDKAIGKRFVQDKPGAVAPVTASTDIAAWAKEGFENTLLKAGAPLTLSMDWNVSCPDGAREKRATMRSPPIMAATYRVPVPPGAPAMSRTKP